MYDQCLHVGSKINFQLCWWNYSGWLGAGHWVADEMRTWMVTQQTRKTLVACVVLREHLTVVPTFLVLLNHTSLLVGIFGCAWSSEDFFSTMKRWPPEMEERVFPPSFNLAKQNLLTTLWHWVRIRQRILLHQDLMTIELVTAFSCLERATSERRVCNQMQQRKIPYAIYYSTYKHRRDRW